MRRKSQKPPGRTQESLYATIEISVRDLAFGEAVFQNIEY
jgi:hypothetical protein